MHDRDIVRHAVQLEPAVKLLRDTSRQLRPHLLSLRHQAAFVFEPYLWPRSESKRLCMRRRHSRAASSGVFTVQPDNSQPPLYL